MYALSCSHFVRTGLSVSPSQEGSPGNTKTDSKTSYGSAPRADSADRPHIRPACVGNATIKSLPELSFKHSFLRAEACLPTAPSAIEEKEREPRGRKSEHSLLVDEGEPRGNEFCIENPLLKPPYWSKKPYVLRIRARYNETSRG
jgi:hypothetical protein